MFQLSLVDTICAIAFRFYKAAFPNTHVFSNHHNQISNSEMLLIGKTQFIEMIFSKNAQYINETFEGWKIVNQVLNIQVAWNPRLKDIESTH